MPFGLWQRWRRRRLLATPFPARWRAIVDERLGYAAAFTDDARRRFLDHLRLFATEKHFEGVGLELTDEMRVVIAGAAARLSMNVTFAVYDHLDTVLVYPSAYVAREKRAGPSDHVVDDAPSARLGQASQRGIVVLAWDAVQRGLSRPHDGHDVALHEFAHVIDMEDGAADGAVFLDTDHDRRAFAAALSQSYEKLRARPRAHVVDAYGATNPAEFFACATEVFFERPALVRRKAPDLYAALESFYQTGRG